MERAKLKGYGLTDEQVDEIMNDHGTVVNAAKNGMSDLQRKVTTLEERLSTVADYDTLKSELETFRAGQPAIDEELKTLREYKQGREYGDRFTAVVGDRNFVNDVTREHVFGKFTASVADKANDGKTDEEILQTVVGGHESEYFKSKVGIRMTPAQAGQAIDDVRAVQDAKYKDNPWYKPKQN